MASRLMTEPRSDKINHSSLSQPMILHLRPADCYENREKLRGITHTYIFLFCIKTSEYIKILQ